jgi:hypothetical protein
MFVALAALALSQPSCTPEQAVAATIEAITATPDQWLDRCVTLSGIADGIVLHAGLEQMYRTSRFAENGNFDPANLRHQIGIDRQELRGHPQLRARATNIQVTGVVDSCQRRSQRIIDAGGIPFLGGYCHYYRGPTVVVSSYTISDRQHKRLTGEAARQRVGNLVEPPADWEWRDELERIAANFAAAMRAGDRVRLGELLSYGSSMEQERIEQILTAPAYRQLRDGTAGNLKLFTHMIGGRFRSDDSGHVFAHLCYCRTSDCSGRWPIASRDADAGRGRPYVCTSISGRIAPPEELSMSAPEGGGWLAEPMGTALQD